MILTIPEFEVLPLQAALFDDDDAVIATTPEWSGPIPGAVAYPVRNRRLVVSTGRATYECETVLNRLLEAMDLTAHTVTGVQHRRVAMLAASLRIMAGRRVTTSGTSDDVIEFALAGIGARTNLMVQVDSGAARTVRAPEVAALVLVQLAANAERHARVGTVTIAHRNGLFHVCWPGASGAREVVTARQRAQRERWGLAFARIAADTLGGAVYPPVEGADGMLVSTLELGLNRLALPLAAIRSGSIIKATRAWDEESHEPPGRAVRPGSRTAACLEAAWAAAGRVVTTNGWCSRAAGDRVWIAIPPDGGADRARDVVDGIGHERALWDGIGEPARSRLFALAALLGSALGTPLPRVPGKTWNRKFAELAHAYRLVMPVPVFEGMGAVDPRIVALLAAEVGVSLDLDGDELLLRVRDDCLDDPLVRIFEGSPARVLKVS